MVLVNSALSWLAAAKPLSSEPQLIIAAIIGIAVVIVLITVAKLHPFLSLIIGAGVLGAIAGQAPGDTVTSFSMGVGATVGQCGVADRARGDDRRPARRLRRG